MTNWLGWIDIADTRQHRWAFEYLARKGILQDDTPFARILSDYDVLMLQSRRWSDNEQTERLVRTMKNAWAQAKLRRKRKGQSKPTNFVLAVGAKKQLRTLAAAQGTTITEALERLITLRAGHEQEHGKQLEEVTARHRGQYRRLQDQQKKAVRAARELWDLLDGYLKKISELEAIVEDQDLTDTLTQDQQKRAAELHQSKRMEVAKSPALRTARLLRLTKTDILSPA